MSRRRLHATLYLAIWTVAVLLLVAELAAR